jgi:hypothetical protein
MPPAWRSAHATAPTRTRHAQSERRVKVGEGRPPQRSLAKLRAGKVLWREVNVVNLVPGSCGGQGGRAAHGWMIAETRGQQQAATAASTQQGDATFTTFTCRRKSLPV